MKKIFYLLISLGAAFAVSCGGDPQPGGGAATLTVEPPSLTFAAVSAPAQTVTVTASNVEWELQVPEAVSEWLKVDTDANTLTVSVADNPKPEKRTGSFMVKPVGNDDVKSKTVTVLQEASDEEYNLTVEPAALTFEAENAKMQEVTVTAEGGLTWKAEVDGEAGSWITVTPKEGKLEVTVADNPDAVKREGNIVIIPSEQSVGKKAIRVTQTEKYFPPSLTIDVDDPDTGLAFGRNGMVKESGQDRINVTAVNVDWDAKAVDADDQPVKWFEVMVNKKDGLSSVGFTVRPNNEFNERVGYVVITADNEDVPGFRVKVTQDAALEHLSTLTENVEVSDMTNAIAFITPNQDWEDPEMASAWSLRFWSDGVEHDKEAYKYTGTGGYMEIELTGEHAGFDYDGIYSLPEGVYTIVPHKEDDTRLDPIHITAGYQGYFEYQHFGSWYIGLTDDKETAVAPLIEGTVTVTKAGEDRYTFAFDCVDDVGFTITGSFTVDLPYEQRGMPVAPPPVTDPNPASLM